MTPEKARMEIEKVCENTVCAGFYKDASVFEARKAVKYLMDEIERWKSKAKKNWSKK